MKDGLSDLRLGYDRVAEDYASEYFEELAHKPFDRQLLDEFAKSVSDQRVIYELGCGPGQVARYLKARGANVRGIDLSLEMVRVASRLNPDIPFAQGDMLSLELDDDSVGAFVLFYSIIHLKRDEVVLALRELRRALVPGGRLLLAFHHGEGELHRDEWFGQPVSIDFRLFQRAEMVSYLSAVGFAAISTMERAPYDFEYPTTRVYAFASKGQ